MVEPHDPNAVLGGVSLNNVDREQRRAAIGYWLAPQARGRGVATHAVRLICGWAFEDLQLARLELTCGPDNHGSQAVAERCGFTREGVLRSHMPFKGGRRDTVVFSLLSGELRSWETGRVPADSWSPAQYERFEAEREQPFWDLLAMVEPAEGGAVVDLGCGTGQLTRALHERVGAAQTTGVDSSARMLERAPSAEGLRFVEGDISDYEPPMPPAVVFSNAALHWLPDHRALFARLRSWLAPGGQLAVQMPDNMDAITHRTAAEVAAGPRFAPYLEGAERRGAILSAEEYAVLLHELGFSRQVVLRRIYAHLLPSRDDVVEWFRGSLLTEYQRLLPERVYDDFLATYRATLEPRLDDRRPYLLPFPRVLMWARLP